MLKPWASGVRFPLDPLFDKEVGMLLWVLLLLLLFLAIGGGIFVTKFLFLVLILILVVALFAGNGL